MPVRVYTYGLGAPRENAALVLEQLRKAHTYRNILTEIERERRTTVRAAMAAHPDMAPLEAQIAELVIQRDAAREAILAVRKVTRQRSESAEQRKRVRDLGGQIRELRIQIKANRQAVAQDTAVRTKLDAAEAHAKQRVRDERARCGVYWGTYLLQEADADRARQETSMPEFRPWRGDGRVSAQLQQGVSVEEMFGDDTQLHVEPVSPVAHDPGSRRGDRRRAARTVLYLRVGSSAARTPIWASWPMVYHRPLPPGSRVKVATVVRRRHDCRTWDWSLHLTIDIPEEATRPSPAGGAIAMDLGFCIRPDHTIRAGYLVADDGFEQEILLPADVVDSVSKADSIRSIRDKNMDAMRAELCGWLRTAREGHEQFVRDVAALEPAGDAWMRLGRYELLGGLAFPAWFTDRTASIHAWRSPARFRALAFYWRAHRFSGDEVPFRLLEGQDAEPGREPWRGRGRDGWRYRDEHLERYESGTRSHALLRRREGYRVLAARMAAKYHTLVLTDVDLRSTQRSPTPESEDVEFAAVKRRQHLVAGSELRGAMVNAFGPARTVKISNQNLTTTCHACGVVNVWDRTSAPRLHTCSACNVQWDQDANSGRNALREHSRAMQESEGARSDNAAKPKPSRSERLRAARISKTAATDRSQTTT